VKIHYSHEALSLMTNKYGQAEVEFANGKQIQPDVIIQTVSHRVRVESRP
jgi:hypothetical protein